MLFDPSNIYPHIVVLALRGCMSYRGSSSQRKDCISNVRRFLSKGSLLTRLILLAHGFLPATLDLLLDRGFCSWPKWYVSVWAESPRLYDEELRYCSELLAIHCCVLDALVEADEALRLTPQDRDWLLLVVRDVISMWPRYTELWDTIHHFRFSLLGAETQEIFAEKLPDVDPLDVLVQHLALRYFNIAGGPSYRIDVPSQTLMVLLFIWVNSQVVEVRLDAARLLMERLGPIWTDSGRTSSVYMNVYHEGKACDILMPGVFSACIQRDLKEPSNVGLSLCATGAMMECFHLFNYDREVDFFDEVLPYALGAARREICLGTRPMLSGNSQPVLSYVYLILSRRYWTAVDDPWKPPELTELMLHEIVTLVAHALNGFVGPQQSLRQYCDIIAWCQRGLDHGLAPMRSTPRMIAIRRLTVKAYVDAKEKMLKIQFLGKVTVSPTQPSPASPAIASSPAILGTCPPTPPGPLRCNAMRRTVWIKCPVIASDTQKDERARPRRRRAPDASTIALWKQVEDNWDKLGEPLLRLCANRRGRVYEEKEWTDMPLKRCAWKECLCSVHRHEHPMKVCLGCGLVAYCGPRCRERDWNEGGHKKRCRGH